MDNKDNVLTQTEIYLVRLLAVLNVDETTTIGIMLVLKKREDLQNKMIDYIIANKENIDTQMIMDCLLEIAELRQTQTERSPNYL
ncbi:MAG: hypothetical protein IKZ96_01155 [Bacilli bacterium]|nr:hypothetical protein [Bacilli bacterium]